MINFLLNRKIYFLGVLIVLLTVQCAKDIEQREMPYNNPKGDYSYSNSMKYYSVDSTLMFINYSDGMLNLSMEDGSIEFYANPKIGYSFKLYAKDTVYDEDTHRYYFFNIDKQIIELNDVSFEIEGTDEYVSSDTVYYDGAIYEDYKYGSFKYKSTNTEDGTYVISLLYFQLDN